METVGLRLKLWEEHENSGTSMEVGLTWMGPTGMEHYITTLCI